MCSSRVDPTFVLEAFKLGADGVYIGCCHLGDCHYQSGNYKTLRRVLLLRKLLEELGIAPQRLRLEYVSASEAQKFASTVTEFTEQLRKLGPLAR
jgi:F420-non-reducing hydrogenase iron-sulfur subunit